ncbi:MmgE/PrpD family protein [Candidatus Omnitrophota bacterium]
MNTLSMLIKNVLDVNYEALPEDVIVETKKQILDTLGTTIAGSVTPNMAELVKLVKGWGGAEESTIIPFGGKVPAPNAALVNGTLSMRLDFDDTHGRDRGHPSRTTVPPAFAVAELKGGGNGRDFITAVALGFDLQCRILRAPSIGIMETPFGPATGIFGTAAIASKILGFNEEKLTNALGLTLQLLTGAGRFAADRSTPFPTKGLNAGLLCRGGIEAVLLAEVGFTVAGDYLEGPKGLFQMIFNGWYQPAMLIDRLGKNFRGALNSTKEYPCCHYLQTPMEATVGIVRQNNIKPEDVEEVVVHTSQKCIHMYEDWRRIPISTVAAEFSGPFAIASTIVHPDVGIGNFSEEAIQDKKILALTEKVRCELDTDLATGIIPDPAVVDIKTKDGRVYSKRVDHPFGSPGNPMSLDDVAAKFKHCCEYSVKPIPKENQDKVIVMVQRLEDVTDVGEIIRLLG